MKEFAEKLSRLEKEISGEKGPFLLFALFLREDAADSWDLLVSAIWLEADKRAGLRYLAPRIQLLGTPIELEKLSRIVIIGRNQPLLEAMQNTINVEHGLAEVFNSNLNGVKINHAFVITSRREVTPV